MLAKSLQTFTQLLMETDSALTVLDCIVYLHADNFLKALCFLGDRSLLSLPSRKS